MPEPVSNANALDAGNSLSALALDYDDSGVDFSRGLSYAYPAGIEASVGIGEKNVSDGSSFSLGVQGGGDPSAGTFSVGPLFRFGGFSFGVSIGSSGVSPQIGLGGAEGISIVPGGSICAGYLCFIPGTASIVSPEALLFIGGIKIAGALAAMEPEDAEEGPVSLASLLFDPLWSLLGALSNISIRVGLGPEARTLSTLEDLALFRAEIQGLLARNARADAIANLKKMLAIPQDPFVRADLADLLDGVQREQNAKGIPFTRAIEGNIRRDVDALESFMREHAAWLKSGGSEAAPSMEEFDAALGRALYLARKLPFSYTEVQEGGRSTIRITASAPFQITDAELAVRYAETLSDFYRLMAAPSSGLHRFLRQRTEWRSKAFAQASEAKAPDGSGLVAADASLSLHLAWITSMRGFFLVDKEGRENAFHKRLGHLAWIVQKNAADAQREALVHRLELVDPPEIAAFSAVTSALAMSTAAAKGRRDALAPGLEALRAVGELEREPFPEECGDPALALDPARARKYTYRKQIVNAFSFLSSALKAARETKDPEAARMLMALARESERRLVAVMRANPAEVVREWRTLVPHGEGFVSTRWKKNIALRLREAREHLEALAPEKLRRLQDDLQNAWRQQGWANRAEKLSQKIEALRALFFPLIARAERLHAGNFSSEEELLSITAADDAAFQEVSTRFRECLDDLQRLKAIVDAPTAAALDELSRPLLLALEHAQKAGANYERANRKRIGAFYLNAHLKDAGIDPRTPLCRVW